MFRRMGRILTFPIRKTKEKAMNAVVLMVLRQVLKVGGGAALFSDNDIERAAGAISLLVGLAMSGFNAYRDLQAKKAQ